MMPLKDKVAVVTGGGSIGRAVARRLTADAAHVVIADNNHDAGIAIAQDVGELFVRCDLSRRGDCRMLIDRTLDVHGALHILVNNAGCQHIDPIESFPEDTWPSMKTQRWGRVINMGSIHSLVASPYKSAYVTAKHGLLGLTRTAALEGGSDGITVNAICPAYMRTPLVEQQNEDQARAHNIAADDVLEQVMLAPSAVKRLIEPKEIAETVAFLCGDHAASITGAAWTVDLGWTAR